ncbi:MAG: hypothetical protein ACRCXT_10405 [Paraclostridium sp.]
MSNEEKATNSKWDELKNKYPNVKFCDEKEIDYSERKYDEDEIYEFDFDTKQLCSRLRKKLEK